MNSKVDRKTTCIWWVWRPQEWYLMSYPPQSGPLEYSRFMMTYRFTFRCNASSWTFHQWYNGRSLTNSSRNGVQNRKYSKGEGNQVLLSGFVPRILPEVWWPSPLADLEAKWRQALFIFSNKCSRLYYYFNSFVIYEIIKVYVGIQPRPITLKNFIQDIFYSWGRSIETIWSHRQTTLCSRGRLQLTVEVISKNSALNSLGRRKNMTCDRVNIETYKLKSVFWSKL